MIFVKVIVLLFLYEMIGIGIVTALSRYSDLLDYDETDYLVAFAMGFTWPFILIILLCDVFAKRTVKFFSELLDRIEAIKEEREMEDEDE